MDTRSLVARGAAQLRGATRRVVDGVGITASAPKKRRDASLYWADPDLPRWRSNSHWRDGLGDEAWWEVGRDHVDIFTTLARGLERAGGLGVTVEWGAGGGANAVAFAPLADRFIAADVSLESLAECTRQVAAVCHTPLETRHINIANPELAAAGLEGKCDTFLCLYVLELTTDPEEALRIVRIAGKVLTNGGMAFVQVKYHTPDWRPTRYRRNYHRTMGDMTTFAIDDFWTKSRECGLTPRLITLVPENRLDSHYAYYALTKP